ncbi:MAG TPA: AAA family ATPase [Myxococcales bacterium]|nr:AAA family ATPase [Deltaproteobacteria bacterium]MBU47703.1 AAA family ATPase [Deltaproteobacteria bacterium]HAA57009.1 AAA family ATPase [Myxococcales bacterium]|tara:strand:+ start:546 stop:1598 length:1053 start_codon:yes stop_codon:yes gene_type:complete
MSQESPSTEEEIKTATAAQKDELDPERDLKDVEELSEIRSQLLTEIKKRIIGQENVIEHLLISLFSRGHTLLVGVPGLAKTLMISTLAEILNLSFNRIQFTPDLMPSDITGTDILEEDHSTGKRSFRFVQGPIFCNMLLADEINRTPPKTQAALLQSMQEYKVTVGGHDYPLSLPFLVMATQNPIEQEGTYPLPEAQLDRFMFQVHIDYPTAEEEEEIVRRTTSAYHPEMKSLLDPSHIIRLQELVRRVPVPEHVIRYAVQLVRKTRPSAEDAAPQCKEFLTWGAGPRASQYLILGGKARAVLHGRFSVEEEDIRALAAPVLSHRMITNFHAEAMGITTADIIAQLIQGS